MKYQCNKCGTEMLDRSDGPYIHYVCPKCGNAVASYDYTRDDPINFDDQVYSVKSIDNKPSLIVLKTVSKINGLNYLKCKELIEHNEEIFSGKARDIIESLRVLKKCNVNFVIFPEFNYSI